MLRIQRGWPAEYLMGVSLIVTGVLGLSLQSLDFKCEGRNLSKALVVWATSSRVLLVPGTFVIPLLTVD